VKGRPTTQNEQPVTEGAPKGFLLETWGVERGYKRVDSGFKHPSRIKIPERNPEIVKVYLR